MHRMPGRRIMVITIRKPLRLPLRRKRHTTIQVIVRSRASGWKFEVGHSLLKAGCFFGWPSIHWRSWALLRSQQTVEAPTVSVQQSGIACFIQLPEFINRCINIWTRGAGVGRVDAHDTICRDAGLTTDNTNTVNANLPNSIRMFKRMACIDQKRFSRWNLLSDVP